MHVHVCVRVFYINNLKNKNNEANNKMTSVVTLMLERERLLNNILFCYLTQAKLISPGRTPEGFSALATKMKMKPAAVKKRERIMKAR